MVLYGIEENEEVCANCEHFCQHYTEKRYRDGRCGFVAVNYGHCVEPRVKERKPCDTCGRFQRSKPQRCQRDRR